MCQIHNVNLEELSSIVKNKQNFNNYELWSEQLSKQLVNVDGEVDMISVTTLECEPNVIDESQLPDCEMYDNNNVIRDTIHFHPRRHEWLQLICHHTNWRKAKLNQTKDSTKSTDLNWKNFLGKGKKKAMNKIIIIIISIMPTIENGGQNERIEKKTR